MKNAKIVLVAQWDGWCGACAADRPLVLTRTGRQHLRTWLTGAADDSRPLTLTCRLCGTGVVVPLERDDPPVAVTGPEERQPATVTLTKSGTPEVPLPDVPLPAVALSPAPVHSAGPELEAARQRVAGALRALVAQRADVPSPLALGVVPPPVQVAPVQPAPPVAAPALPLQRTAASGGLAELQLLADGIDLLSTRRA